MNQDNTTPTNQTPTYQPLPPSQASAPVGPAPSTSPTDTFGIISIVMAFFFLHIPGIVLGVLGINRARREGRSAMLSHVGWILNTIFMVLVSIGLVLFIINRNSSKEAELSTTTSTTTSTSTSSDSSSQNSDLKLINKSNYSIKVPTSYIDLPSSAMPAAADLGKGNASSEEYIVIAKEARSSVPSISTAKAYGDLLVDRLINNSQFKYGLSSRIYDISNSNVYDVADYKVTGVSSGESVVYFIRYIRTSSYFYQIITWTIPGNQRTAEPILKAAIASFKEY